MNPLLYEGSSQWTPEQRHMIHYIHTLGDLLKERPRRSVYRRFALEHGWPSPETIVRQFGSWSEALAAAGYDWQGDKESGDLPEKAPRYTKADILYALTSYAEEMGPIITLKKYQEWRKRNPQSPSHYHIVKTFGSWHDACTEADLEASVTYSKKEICESLKLAVRDLGLSLSFESYREWAKQHNKPSTKAILHRYGSWSAAMHAVESELFATKY